MFNETQELRKSFDFYAKVKHWSGCWGTYTSKQALEQTEIEDIKSISPWITDFLHPTDPERVDFFGISEARGSKNKGLVGTYRAVVKFQPAWQLQERYSHTWIIVVCADGVALRSWGDYEELKVGKELFSGYELPFGRSHYTLEFPFWVDNQGFYKHPYFKEPTGTVMGTHLYHLEKELISDQLVIDGITPVWSSALVHKLPAS